MTSDEQTLFHELIVAARKLATVSDNAATVLSQDFEDMVRDPLAECVAVLDKCPNPEFVWDGSIREEDLEVEYFSPTSGQQIGAPPKGVRVKHKITGIGRESYTKPTQEENEAVVREAVEKAVRKDWETRAPG